MLDPPGAIVRVLCSKFDSTTYLSLFGLPQFMGRLQISVGQQAKSWMRIQPIDFVEGEIDLRALRAALPHDETIAWEDRPRHEEPDRLELQGTSNVWRLVLVSPVKVTSPTAQDEADAFGYLAALRALIWAS